MIIHNNWDNINEGKNVNMLNLTKREKIIVSLLILIVAGFIGEQYYVNHLRLPGIVVESQNSNEASEITLKEERKEEKAHEEEWILVDICGEVFCPGVVKLRKGDRIVDGINLAGGLLKSADRSQVNLARVLLDGEQIYIPKIGENVKMINNPKGIGGNAKSDKVNINTALLDEIETLGGIGKVLGERILKYRETHGRFNDIKEIMKVSGVGEKKFESIKDSISID